MFVYIIVTFSLKFIIIALFTVLLYQLNKNLSESFVGGWLLMYQTQITFMILLSFGQAMNRNNMLLCLLLVLAVLFYLARKKMPETIRALYVQLRAQKILDYVIWAIVLLVCVYIFAHNSFFYDSTWDAHAYEMPRIELFSQKATLMVNMRSAALNIFCNEWNGELNGIFYRIMGGTNQAIFIGNAEIFFYGCFVILWFCNKIGMGNIGKRICLLSYAGFPVTVMMAMTAKGDFLAMIIFIIALVWLIDYIDKKDKYSFLFLMISMGIAGGTKVTMLPFVGLSAISTIIFIFIVQGGKLYLFWKYIKSIWKEIVIGGFCVLFSCFRYILNIFYFGNPFQRVEVEAINITIGNVGNTIYEMIKTLLDPANIFTYTGSIVDVLNSDLGIMGFLFVIAVFTVALISSTCLAKKQYTFKTEKLSYLIPLITGCVFVMLSTTWYSWSVRYYAPWLLILYCYIIRYMERGGINNFIAGFSICLCIISIYSTVALSMQYGDVTHGSWKSAREKTQLQREYGYHPYLLEDPQGGEDINDLWEHIQSGKNILICNGIDTAVSYLFGEDNSNDITFCTIDELPILQNNSNWDVINVSDQFLTSDIESLFPLEQYETYTPCNSIIRAHVFVKK